MAVSAFKFILLGILCVIMISDIQAYVPILGYTTSPNSFYYISKATFSSFKDAKEWCSRNGGGGYPAEIDSLEELKLLESLVTGYRDLRVYIAGTDAQKDGTWLSQRTGVQLNVFHWNPLEPNNYHRQEDCLELLEKFGGRMNDNVCDNIDGEVSVLCERQL